MNVPRISNHIWKVAKEVLRDPDGPGGYREIILPMAFICRLDAALQPTRRAVRDRDAALAGESAAERDKALRLAAGRPYYNTSELTLIDLGTHARPERLTADFNAYLDGFSPDIRAILDQFGFRDRVQRLSNMGALGTLISKFTSAGIHLGPDPVRHADGTIMQPGLDKHGMRSVFEELARRCNEETGEGAGEHWTPRDAVRLMAKLVFLPVARDIQPGSYSLYDGACGVGGMLNVANETLRELAAKQGKKVSTHLYGQDINADTAAICRANMLLNGDGGDACSIIGGAAHSTLSDDAFPAHQFDFMLSNPPYGQGWKADLERLGGKKGIRDPRFTVEHAGDRQYSLATRASDSQMMFLVNTLSKMKRGTRLGSRIAQIHNGGSLFTGGGGQGESNIRRWIIENDWLEAIVALPNNILYNTGIAIYVWVLTNHKPEHRRGKVQLIDATGWFRTLRKNLGKKTRELGDEDIARICNTFLAFDETEHSRILDNAAFGYWKVTVERPLRIEGVDSNRVYPADEIRTLKEFGKRRESAPPVIRKIHNQGTGADPLRGLIATAVDGKRAVVEYEPDPELRDTERVPLHEEGGIEAFLEREIMPYSSDAWCLPDSAKIGYRIDFNRYFYRPQPVRRLEEIRAEIRDLERETGGLLENIMSEVNR